MIRLREWLYRLFFGQQHELVDLRDRLRFANEQVATLKMELIRKEDEVKALVDAMLIGSGRQPMYSEPVKVEVPEVGSDEQLSNTLRMAKGRNWSHTAAAMEQLANNRANGGVRG